MVKKLVEQNTSGRFVLVALLVVVVVVSFVGSLLILNRINSVQTGGSVFNRPDNGGSVTINIVKSAEQGAIAGASGSATVTVARPKLTIT